MSIHTFKKLSISDTQNVFGETPLPFAPHVNLSNGESVVPQQYLDVTRDLITLEAVISCITFSDQYPIFAGEINGVLYLQVGVIGTENYPNGIKQDSEVKIVYGRRWLIEPTTTTSEVVQTVMLAIKKAREHELREKVVKTINHGENKTTPFNSHMDLPQMAGNASDFSPNDGTLQTSDSLQSCGTLSSHTKLQAQVKEVVTTVQISSFGLTLHKLHYLEGGRALVELDLVESSQSETHFPEMKDQRLSLVCDINSITDLMHTLIAQVVGVSDRYIENTLQFNGFARFSHSICINKVAEFSYQSRNIKHTDPRFSEHFKEMSYQVDSSKAPSYAQGSLGEKQRSALSKHDVKAGYTPIEKTEDMTLETVTQPS